MENPLKTIEDLKKAIDDVQTETLTKSAAAAFAELAYCIGRREAFVTSQQICENSFSRMAGHIDALKDEEAKNKLVEMPTPTSRPQ